MMTSVLRDSLGGNCRTTMIANCSIDRANIDVSWLLSPVLSVLVHGFQSNRLFLKVLFLGHTVADKFLSHFSWRFQSWKSWYLVRQEADDFLSYIQCNFRGIDNLCKLGKGYLTALTCKLCITHLCVISPVFWPTLYISWGEFACCSVDCRFSSPLQAVVQSMLSVCRSVELLQK